MNVFRVTAAGALVLFAAIAGFALSVKSDYQKMLAAGFPIKITETADTHDGTSTDWEALIPQSSTWLAP